MFLLRTSNLFGEGRLINMSGAEMLHCLFKALSKWLYESNSMIACYFLSFFDVDSLVAKMVKCLPAMWETWVRFLGQKDPLEKEMATHSSTLA